MSHVTIHDHSVSLGGDSEEISSAIRYLENHLSREESDVFFREAKTRGSAKFEDHHGRNFTLKYTGSGSYSIERR